MSEADVELEAEAAHAEELRAMFALHRDVGRRAMTKAMLVLDQIDAAEIPVNVAVQLLKFGAELERRAMLGIEPVEGDDPFDALSKSLG